MNILPSCPLSTNLRHTDIIWVPHGLHTACQSLSPVLPGWDWLSEIQSQLLLSSALFKFNSCPAGQHLCRVLTQLCPAAAPPCARGGKPGKASWSLAGVRSFWTPWRHSCPYPTCVNSASVEPWPWSAQAQISDTSPIYPPWGSLLLQQHLDETWSPRF